MSSLGEDLELTARLEDLQATNQRLVRQLERAHASKANLVDAVYQAARDSFAGFRIGKVPAPPKDQRRSTAEVACAVLSDWQLAKTTPTYDSAVCEERVMEFGRKLIRLTELHRSAVPVRELHLWSVGDMVEGELIFPGQSHLIDASLYRQVTIDGPRIYGRLLKMLLPVFDKVTFTGVIGNHGSLGGRARREYNPESNADRMLYRIVATMFEDEPRLVFNIPDGGSERNWYAVPRIGDHGFLLFHGDQVRGHSGLPWYGFYKKILGWKTGAVPEDFSYFVCGHWHTPTMMTLNHVRGWVNGSTESSNTYAQEQLAATGRPSQWLLFVSPKKGVTAEYLVDLS